VGSERTKIVDIGIEPPIAGHKHQPWSYLAPFYVAGFVAEIATSPHSYSMQYLGMFSLD